MIKSQTANGHHVTLLGKRYTAASHEALDALIEARRAKVTAKLGRLATDHELVHGLARPPLTREEQMEAQRGRVRKQYENRVAAGEPSAEQIRLAAAQRRANDERRAGMTPAQRELEDAQLAADAETQRLAAEAEKTEIKATKPYASLRSNLDELIFSASYDEAVTSAELAALEAQRDQLEQTLDIATVRGNVTELQKVIAGRLDLEAANLKAANDALAHRRQLLAAGTVFDDIDTEIVGDMAFVSLTVNGETKKISQAKYDGRQSDESLKSELFGGEARV